MQDLTGKKVPSEQLAKGWAARIKELQDEMAPYCVSLTPDGRKHTLKFPPGGESIVQKVGGVVRGHDVNLPGITADGMDADLLVTQRLKPVRDAAELLYQLTDDTIVEAGSECWYAATAYYTALSRMVSSFPDIKNMVAEVASFFATWRRKQATQDTPTTPTK
jgi:hypothetical protein